MTSQSEYDRERRSIEVGGRCTRCSARQVGLLAQNRLQWNRSAPRRFSNIICSSCRKTWDNPFLSGLIQQQIKGPERVVDTKPQLLPRPVDASLIDVGSAQIVSYRSNNLSSVIPLSDEVRAYNNLASNSAQLWTISMRQTTTFRVQAEFERVSTTSGGGGLKFAGIAEFEARMAHEMKTRNATDYQYEMTLEQSTSINVPARTHIKLIIHWKMDWRGGVARIVSQQRELDIPYWVTSAIRLDLETIDVERRKKEN